MINSFKVEMPLKIQYATKKDGTPYYFRVDMNTYRNTHFVILNKAKQAYKEIAKSKIPTSFKANKIKLLITFFSRHKNIDLSNVCSIHDKFFLDTLTSEGLIPDDTVKEVSDVTYKWGGLDKIFPRVVIQVIKDDTEDSNE